VRVYVRLHGVLRRHHPGPDLHTPIEADIEPGSVVADLMPLLGLPDGLVYVASVNGEAVEPDEVLSWQDQVSLFPPVAGGQKQQEE
jgi:molybdopterin converting factor small subunit